MDFNFKEWLYLLESSDEYKPIDPEMARKIMIWRSMGRRVQDMPANWGPNEYKPIDADLAREIMMKRAAGKMPSVTEVKPEIDLDEPEVPEKTSSEPVVTKLVVCPFCKENLLVKQTDFGLGSNIKCPKCKNTFGRGAEDGSQFSAVPIKKDEIGSYSLEALVQLLISNKLDTEKAKAYFIYWSNNVGARYNEVNPKLKAKELATIAWTINANSYLGKNFWDWMKQKMKNKYPKIISEYEGLEKTPDNTSFDNLSPTDLELDLDLG